MAGEGLGVEISQIIKIARWPFSGGGVKKRTTKCEDLNRRGDIPDKHSLKTELLQGSYLLFPTISFETGCSSTGMKNHFLPVLATGRTFRAASRTVLAALAVLVFSCGLLVHAPLVSAATLAEDMVQVTKDACVNVAKKRGYAVEEVTSAVPADGDSSSVVLRLSKGGERYEFNCGFSQNIREYVAPAPARETAAVAQRNDRVATQQPARVANQQPARVAVQQPARVAVQQPERVAVQRDRDRVVETTERKGGFNPLLLLPLLLLPLLFFLRPKEAADVSATKMGSYVNPTPVAKTTTKTTTAVETVVAKVFDAVLRTQDAAIEVRSGAGVTNAVTRSLAAGSTVKLNGRYLNDWAELADGGWIDIKSLAKDPRA